MGDKGWVVDLSKPFFEEIKYKWDKSYCRDEGVAEARLLIALELGNGLQMSYCAFMFPYVSYMFVLLCFIIYKYSTCYTIFT